MSQENVELTLRAVEAWNRRDAEAMIPLWDPEGELSGAFQRTTEGRVFRGHAEIRQALDGLAEFSEASHAEFPEIRDLGDRVLGLGRVWIRFAAGVELDNEAAILATWRNGKLVEARTWINHAEALEAAGLEE